MYNFYKLISIFFVRRDLYDSLTIASAKSYTTKKKRSCMIWIIESTIAKIISKKRTQSTRMSIESVALSDIIRTDSEVAYD